MLITDRHDLLAFVVGWFLLFCSLVWVSVGIVNFLPSACHLKLDAEGLTTVVVFYSEHLSWRDAAGFRTFQFPMRVLGGSPFGPRHVVADIYDSANVFLKYRAQNRKQWGFDFFFPTNYGLSARELADKLNAWKRACDP